MDSMQVKKEDFLSSGCTILNLACSGTPYGCAAKGKYHWIVGDSSSGKTFLTLTFLAEASINHNFDDYDLIFDNVEDGALMDVSRFFGQKLADRIQPPAVDEDGEPVYSQDIEDFYCRVEDRIEAIQKNKKGARPFIWLLDSMDALSSKAESAKFKEIRKASTTGATVTGDYGDGKAKINSRYMRRVVAGLRDTKSILIVLSQTRDNFDAGMFGPQTTSAGGRSLKFYAVWQMWTSLGSRIKKTVLNTERQVGVHTHIQIKKNRLTGREWKITIPIYHTVGIDNVGATIDYLLAEKHWESTRGGIIVPEFDFKGSRGRLIEKIESEDLEQDLDEIVTDFWKRVEEASVVHRKSKY